MCNNKADEIVEGEEEYQRFQDKAFICLNIRMGNYITFSPPSKITKNYSTANKQNSKNHMYKKWKAWLIKSKIRIPAPQLGITY